MRLSWKSVLFTVSIDGLSLFIFSHFLSFLSSVFFFFSYFLNFVLCYVIGEITLGCKNKIKKTKRKQTKQKKNENKIIWLLGCKWRAQLQMFIAVHAHWQPKAGSFFSRLFCCHCNRCLYFVFTFVFLSLF